MIRVHARMQTKNCQETILNSKSVEVKDHHQATPDGLARVSSVRFLTEKNEIEHVSDDGGKEPYFRCAVHFSS